MSIDWDAILISYLHDPPDKARDIRGHEGRAAALASLALDREVTREELHRDTRIEDQLASIAERLPMPAPGENYALAVGATDGRLRVRHPLSAAERQVSVAPLADEAPAESLRSIVRKTEAVQDPHWARRRFLALWRLWPEELAARQAGWAHLPADTRQPDHTIWQHMDMVAGLQPALAGSHGAAFLSFNLGPVHSFIEAARTVRDLWTGSYLLSWLTFAAMRPLLDAVGPAAFVFPALRGNPLLDRYLCEPAQGLDLPIDSEAIRLPCLPNRFVAVVPMGPHGEDARALAQSCEQACTAAWQTIAGRVRERLDCFASAPHGAAWDRWWDDQVASYFAVSTAVLPWRECADAEFDRLLDKAFVQRIKAVRTLAGAIAAGDRPRYAQDKAGLWMGRLEMLGRLSAARRAARHVPPYRATGEVPAKCSLLGTYEQMGPANLEESHRFWKHVAENPPPGGSRVGRTERLCAVSLVKRFAWPAYFATALGQNPAEGRFADTATVAAATWLRQEPALDPNQVRHDERDWSGQWLHWPRPDFDPDEPIVPPRIWRAIHDKKQAHKKQAHGDPPAYYAVLMLDGDHLGRWLRGDLGPTIGAALHPTLRTYFEGRAEARDALQARRPVGPALHASISTALANFALHFVPDIVDKHHGVLIYAGGDDVLALLPTATALACARALAETFRQDWQVDPRGRERLLMGGAASVSAGVAVVHYKEDLRFALDRARRAEKAVKDSGRNALCLAVCRRSGEHRDVLLPWDECGAVEQLVSIFLDGVSDRWAYRLRGELPTLQGEGMPSELVRAEVERLLGRLEKEDRERVQQPALALLDRYHAAMTGPGRGRTAAQALEGFVTLCQAASFLARGRDA